MLNNHDAGQLADAIGYLYDSQMTGPQSMIDEAAGKFARISPEVDRAHRAFSEARWMHQRSYDPSSGLYSESAWLEVVNTAKDLAAALRALAEVQS